MNLRATALLALAVAALGAFVWLYEIRGADERAEKSEAEKRIFRGVEADDVTQMTLRAKDGVTMRLEKSDGSWRLVEPIAFPADGTNAEAVAATLAGLRSEAVVEEPGPPAEYGLAGEPDVRFVAGGEERVLRIGDASPVGSNTYVATADERPVYVVASYRTTSLSRTLDEMREKRLARFDRDAVVGAHVRWKGGAVRLVRDEQDPEAWRLVEPLEAKADARTISKLLSDLEFLRATSFDDEPSESVRRRLETPELAIELRTRADGKEGALRVALGAPEGTELPAHGQVEGAVYELPAGRLADFPRTVDAYRDKTLARFIDSEARRFELAFHAEGEAQSHLVTGHREEGAWKTSPETLDEGQLEAMLRELSGLDGQSVAAESMGAAERAKLGLEPPRVVLRVFGGPEEGADAPLAEVHLGVSDPQRGVAARRPDREIVYWLAPERADALPTSLEALRARFVEAPEAPPSAPAAEAAPEGGAPDAGAAASDAPGAAASPGAEAPPAAGAPSPR